MTKRKNAEIATAPENGSVLCIPLNKLKKSPRNARTMPHPKADLLALAASIAANGMLQNPVVEPELKDGKPTGYYFVTIGEGRRQAQLLRAKNKEISKTEPVRCVIDTAHNALEISLAENAIRSAMHPADQFEAFFKLHAEEGLSAEDIAARFGVTPAVVKQRLKLAAVSPVLMRAYRDEELNLDQLTAFAITDDHARQQEVWDMLGADCERADILGALNGDHVEADDRRAVFVGLEAYQAAGGTILRDLFDDEQGGFLTDPALLHRLANEKLQHIADSVKAEGWKWIEVMPNYDYSSVAEMRRIYPDAPHVSEDVQEKIDALEAELHALESGDESEDAIAEAERIEQDIVALRGEHVFDPEDIARAGAIVCIGHDGEARIERGFIRREDDNRQGSAKAKQHKDGPAPLPETLVADLTAHRTMALRNAVANNRDTALIAVVHVLACETFFPQAARQSCLQVRCQSEYLERHAPGIEDSEAAIAMAKRHDEWVDRIPEDAEAMWAFVLTLNQDDLLGLLAHCASRSVNAVTARGIRETSPGHADQLAQAVMLDMRQAWKPTAKGYFARVSKERILEAVREAVSPEAAANLATMKKLAMAEAAEQRMTDRGWLPEVLRLPEPVAIAAE